MKKNIIYISVMGLVLILLIADILTRLFLLNSLDMSFESSSFNNIITPVFTIIASLIYGAALYNTINQNKILLSQNLKPYFENEIERLIKKSKKTQISKVLLEDKVELPKTINFQNYTDTFHKLFIAISKNIEYISDLNRFKKGEIFTREYFKTRSYYKEIMFLSDFTFELSPINIFHNEVIQIIDEINLSKLIEDDKYLLKKRIKRTLVGDYMALVAFLDKNSVLTTPIPFFSMNNDDCKFININKTDFRKNYDLFNKVL